MERTIAYCLEQNNILEQPSLKSKVHGSYKKIVQSNKYKNTKIEQSPSVPVFVPLTRQTRRFSVCNVSIF